MTAEQPTIGTDQLKTELDDLIYKFNGEATGITDGLSLQLEFREVTELLAGLSGWTWGGTAYIDLLWVRADLRGRGMGTRLLDEAEAEAVRRECTQVVLSTHSFQAPALYRDRGYTEFGRVQDYPRGHAHLHFVKQLAPKTRTRGHPIPAEIIWD